MIIAIFRARIRAGVKDTYQDHALRMAEIATAMPGFISYKTYYSEDGERVSVHEWESAADLSAWRDHPEHKAVQAFGREHYYKEYTLYVADEPRTSRYQTRLATGDRIVTNRRSTQLEKTVRVYISCQTNV